MLSPLLRTDPASPRLTVYDDARGARMEFSAQTLDNWASKVANLLDEEFELDADAPIAIDLPTSWQSAVIALGAYNSGRTVRFAPELLADATPTTIFTTVDNAARWAEVPDCVVVSDDPFGRGVVEAGGELPFGTVDFGPTVRFYGDQYFGASPELAEFATPDLGPARYWVPGWRTAAEFRDFVLAPLAAGGSVCASAGPISADRREEIMDTEKIEHILGED